MGLERDLHDLLYCHDCVIVPHWGGFLTHYRPARLDSVKELAFPPGKDLSFNKNLDRNDGLLADHLAKRDGLGYKAAQQAIDNAVKEWRRTLETQGRLELPQIGIFYKDSEKNLQFDPDGKVNFLKEAYGLHPVAAVPVKASVEPVIRTLTPAAWNQGSTTDEKPARIIWAAAALAAVLFGAAAFFAYRMGGTPESQWSGVDPFRPGPQRTHVPSEVVPEAVVKAAVFSLPTGLLGVREVPLTPDAAHHIVVDLGSPEPVAVAETTAVAVPSKEVAVPAQRGRFHIIGGCFAQEENADRFLQELQERGFEARKLPLHNKLHPVAFGTFSRRSEALKALARVKESGTYSAWLLVR